MKQQKSKQLRVPKQASMDPNQDFPYHYREVNLGEQSPLKTKNEILSEYLTLQKQDYKQYVKQKRVFVLKNRKEELFKQRQSMSYGHPKHPDPFKRATQAQEFFEKEKPTLKFPMDTILNTFDNTKQFLKPLDYSKEEKKTRWAELRENNFHHYKGDPWNYVKNDSEYFGEFQIYKLAAEVPEDKKAKYAQREKYLVPVSFYPKIFQTPPADSVHVKVPLNPVHQVKYRPSEIQTSSYNSSKLNEMQKVKPFTPATTHGHFFQKHYNSTTYESTTIESVPTKAVSSGSRQVGTQSFIGRNSSPNRSNSQRGTSRATSPT